MASVTARGGGRGDGKEAGGEETGAASGQHAPTAKRRETCERAAAAFDTRTPRPNLVVLNRACSDGGLHDQFTPKVAATCRLNRENSFIFDERTFAYARA